MYDFLVKKKNSAIIEIILEKEGSTEGRKEGKKKEARKEGRGRKVGKEKKT